MITVVVAGLGRVGTHYEAPDGAPPRSHVGAALACSALRIAGAVDPDDKARAQFRTRWPELADVPLAGRLADLPVQRPDVIALCTPPETRVADVADALAMTPRALIVEKPLALDVASGAQIIDRTASAGAILRVNFHRRLDPGHAALRRDLPKAPPARAVLRYGKGLYNYGAHVVDWLLDWFGDVESVQAVGDPNAASPSFICRMTVGFDAHVLGMDDVLFDQFDADLFFADRRIEILNGGCEMRQSEPVADRYYPGYIHLGPARDLKPTGPVGGLTELYEAVGEHLVRGADLPGCNGDAALAGLNVLAAVERSVARGGSLERPGVAGHDPQLSVARQ